MANQTKDPRNDTEVSTGRPLQRIPWSKKIADKGVWFQQNADYYISISCFQSGQRAHREGRDLKTMYEIYNGRFPEEKFKHITDPLNARDIRHTRYPAKVRPTTMLRTNIDLLIEEFVNRPVTFQVENLGEDGYNSYLDSLSKALEQNLSEHFLAIAQGAMQQQGFQPGQDFQQIPQDEQIELPDSVKERFKGSYKDNLAIFGQKYVKRMMRDNYVMQKLREMFKDWLIAGEPYSYKNIENGNFVYRRVSPMAIDYDKSSSATFVEDGQWVIEQEMLTLSDVVDLYYDELTDTDHSELESTAQWSTPYQMFSFLSDNCSADLYGGKIAVYHIQWKGRKQILHVSYTDPLTGVTQIMVLDEDTPPSPEMKILKREWVNEVYECTRLGRDIYVRKRAIPVQRNEMNNLSRCKLCYNGRRYSDTHATNISVMELGISKAILYMITDFLIEKTMAKNKGKIALLDKMAIPHKDGWNDEKALYYADAMGYMLLNRNQPGVDRSWNQYQVLDMSLWNDLKSLIELRDSFSREWDELLGINPQRKAQIQPSSPVGTTQAALAQSNVITGLLFTLFEEFMERELQGFLDYSKFLAVEGPGSAFNLSDFDRDLIEMDPASYSWSQLGLFIRFSSEQLKILQQYKQNIQAMIQNGVPQSTILTVQSADNVAELGEKLKMLEEKEMQIAQAAKEDEHKKMIELEQIKEKYESIRSLLKIDEINAEWDRRDQNEVIKGSYLNSSMEETATQGTVAPGPEDIASHILETQRLLAENRQKHADRAQADRHHRDEMAIQKEQMQVKREEIASRERNEKLKARTARANKVAGEK